MQMRFNQLRNLTNWWLILDILKVFLSAILIYNINVQLVRDQMLVTFCCKCWTLCKLANHLFLKRLNEIIWFTYSMQMRFIQLRNSTGVTRNVERK
jgi:hypothetical protein